MLSNSLALFGKEPKNLEINDERTIKDIKDDGVFKKKIKELTEEYGKETGYEVGVYDCDKNILYYYWRSI